MMRTRLLLIALLGLLVPEWGIAQDEAYFVRALSHQAKVEISAENDQLLLDESSVLPGVFAAKTIHLKTAVGDRDLKTNDLAAIEGGAGQGRKPRVYFRNGTVTQGDLSWSEGTFKTKSLGTLKLTPQTLRLLILHSPSKETHVSVAPTAISVTTGGEVAAELKPPSAPLRSRWIMGDLSLPWSEIATLRPLSESELGHEVALKDGSRLHAWLPPSTAKFYATRWADLVALLDGKSEPTKIAGLSLQTTEGSVIAGTWAEEEIQVAANSTALKVRTAEIQDLTVSATKNGEPIFIEIRMTGGTTLKALPVSDTVGWKWRQQTLALAWPRVAQIHVSEAAATKP